MWKEEQHNQYPSILLSDCSIENIRIEDGKIIAVFSQYGFFRKELRKNKYYRTDGGQIIFDGCNIDDVDITEIRVQQLSEEQYFKTMNDIMLKDLIKNVNGGSWRLEIVEEFYAVGKGFYIAQIHTDEDSFWCHIKIYFKDLIYCWNSIRTDCPY